MQYTKLAPALALAYRDYLTGGPETVIRHARLDGLAEIDESAGAPRVHVFLECAQGAILKDIDSSGAVVHASGDSVRTAIVPFDGLAELTDHPDIEYIVPSYRLSYCVDVASAKIGLDHLRARGPVGGLSGDGVIVGIVDSGIDTRHPAFEGRIERIWDQSLTDGTGVPEGWYGAELRGAELSRSADLLGHGTQVAGIAAGSHNTFMGIAPAARIVSVKTDRDRYGDVGIAAGVRYIFRVAHELGLPAVVNLSWGGHANAHDGSDPLSIAIDRATGPRRIVCCAAGNEGIADIHAQTWVPAGGSREFHVAADTSAFRLHGWCAPTDGLAVSLVSPSGQETSVKRVHPSGTTEWQQLPDSRVRFATRQDPGNRDFHLQVSIDPGPWECQPGLWRLRWYNNSTDVIRVDAWLAKGADVNTKGKFIGPEAEPSMRIGSPGAATSAITVASFTTRNEWLLANGNREDVPLEVDTISNFSSDGPRRDDYPKPDVAAPGAMIISCRSSDYQPPSRWAIDSDYTICAGTSIACPFITGIAALLLGRQSKSSEGLDPADLKSILREHCVDAAGNLPGTFDRKWGYGLIDASEL